MTQKPYIIVLGNEKGGTGKSTAAMHIIVSLLKMGFKVGTIDVDARQGTLTRYIENRKASYIKDSTLELPEHFPLLRSTMENQKEAEADEIARFLSAIENLQGNDFIVMDTPGSDTHLSRLVHSYADTLITPLNDSFIDLDMLVRLEPSSMNILRPSTYAEMVWEQRKQRAIRGAKPTDWVVMRNRLSSINAKNKEEMERVIGALSKRLSFRVASGFGERVIFRELFLTGRTLLDLEKEGQLVSLSHVAARQELRALLAAINLPVLEERLAG
jgi:chromosome partitioning protein